MPVLGGVLLLLSSCAGGAGAFLRLSLERALGLVAFRLGFLAAARSFRRRFRPQGSRLRTCQGVGQESHAANASQTGSIVHVDACTNDPAGPPDPVRDQRAAGPHGAHRHGDPGWAVPDLPAGEQAGDRPRAMGVHRGRPAAAGLSACAHRPRPTWSCSWSGFRSGQNGLGSEPKIADHRIRVARAADQDDPAGGSALDRNGEEVGTQRAAPVADR